MSSKSSFASVERIFSDFGELLRLKSAKSRTLSIPIRLQNVHWELEYAALFDTEEDEEEEEE